MSWSLTLGSGQSRLEVVHHEPHHVGVCESPASCPLEEAAMSGTQGWPTPFAGEFPALRDLRVRERPHQVVWCESPVSSSPDAMSGTQGWPTPFAGEFPALRDLRVRERPHHVVWCESPVCSSPRASPVTSPPGETFVSARVIITLSGASRRGVTPPGAGAGHKVVHRASPGSSPPAGT